MYAVKKKNHIITSIDAWKALTKNILHLPDDYVRELSDLLIWDGFIEIMPQNKVLKKVLKHIF
jgi:hypothetical protein